MSFVCTWNTTAFLTYGTDGLILKRNRIARITGGDITFT